MLQAEAVSVYREGRALLDGVSCTVRPGSCVAIMGANGAGKTSLLRVFLGLLPPERGRVLLHGQPLPVERRAMARQVASVPQQGGQALRLPARAVVAQGRYSHRGLWGLTRHDHQLIDAAMADCAVLHLAQRDCSTLSGGERQRVLLARALACDAPFLLLDEPTANLDPAQALAVIAILQRLRAQGRGLAVVLHDLEQVERLADQVLLLGNGRAIAAGPCQETLHRDTLHATFGAHAARVPRWTFCVETAHG